MDTNNNDNIIEINIKILNDKYEIFLNKIYSKRENIISYIGRNILTNEKLIIDVYIKNIMFFARKLINNIIKLENKNIHKILDVIIEKNMTYIIKPYYERYTNNSLIHNSSINNTTIYTFFIQLFESINYLFDNNIEIEYLDITNILYHNNNLILSPYYDNSDLTKHIIYGSPLFLPFKLNNKSDYEKKIINNIKNLSSEIITNKNDLYYDIIIILSNKCHNITTLLDNIKTLCIKNNKEDNKNINTDIFQLEI